MPCVFQIRHQDQITPPRAYILPHGVFGKSKNASSLYMRTTALFAPPLPARSSPVRHFVWISYYICKFTHTLVRGAPPPPASTHKGSINLYADQAKKNSKRVYLVLDTRVSTHLIMACSKGTEAETTSQTRACVHTLK